MFFLHGRSAFFNFFNSEERERVARRLFRATPCTRALVAPIPGALPGLGYRAGAEYGGTANGRGQIRPKAPFRHLLSPAVLMHKWEATKAWSRRYISNFDYLMLLNSAAGACGD